MPDFISDDTPAGSAHIVKPARAQYELTAADFANGRFTVDLVWKTPFGDTNYSVAVGLEVIPPADPTKYSIVSFVSTLDKITVNCLTTTAAPGDPYGDVVRLHAIAIHD